MVHSQAALPVLRSPDGELTRLKVTVRGAVQGVGFRPFVYRLATELRLTGWVNNSAQGVFIEVEGPPAVLQDFLLRVERDRPAISFIQSLESSFADPVGYQEFTIQASVQGEKTALVLPDIATCPDCFAEIFDPQNRRYLYPFTNCTNCGPRFTIIESLPYDRSSTTMKKFQMCDDCRREYENPLDRRFHAQPNACPECGPKLKLWAADGTVLSHRHNALLAAAQAIRDGRVVAVKGLGGFHLMVDARNESAVRLLRERKRREEKPFALMYPSLETLGGDCEVDSLEERLLRSPESPIVLLCRKRGRGSGVCDLVAPGNPYIGAMLPYTPLHYLLMSELQFPVVATSGNLSDEPICTDEHEALRRLAGIADVFLVHDRPIVRHVDDSIVRVVLGRDLVLRRARGFAPLPMQMDQSGRKILAVGAHQKNTIAASVEKYVFISQHIGDLETVESYRAFEEVIESFGKLYELQPEVVACDLHPDYVSTEYARRRSERVVGVQHHYAHALACMAENGIEAPALAVTWDGSGYGPDGTIWGGEFLKVEESGFERAAHFRTFMLPGGEKAVREPRRVGLAVLYEIFGEDVFSTELAPMKAFAPTELRSMMSMLSRGINAPRTSSVGRLFDAVASLVGLRQKVRFEGQAAMEWEFLATDQLKPESGLNGAPADTPYAIKLRDGIVDWEPMVLEILRDVSAGVSATSIAMRFHETLSAAMVLVAESVGVEKVVLTGGCFQNKLLTELAVERLREAGFRPYWHQRVPPNDGGIALGQVVAAIRELASGAKAPQ
jgi:hydrogenase maturation protein HypF